MCSLLITLILSLSPLSEISLLTVEPGQHLYERYGHTAIRVSDPMQGIDLVFNYGLFSFEDSHFYWHFVQGQTWYELGMQTYPGFMYEYRVTHRTVWQQTLQLTSEEKDSIFHALIINAQPENCKYLYNFVFDNCATRPYHLIQSVLSDSVNSSYSSWEGMTYRQLIHHYTRHGSWAEWGINLVFGYKADRPISGEERLFLPEQLRNWLDEAHRPDGTPVTCHLSPVTYHQSPVTSHLSPFPIEPVPWYATWYFGMVLFAALMVGINWYDRRRGRRSRWVDWTLYVGYALMAALLIFLIFFSIHPLVSIGWYVFIIPAIHLCTRLIYIWH